MHYPIQHFMHKSPCTELVPRNSHALRDLCITTICIMRMSTVWQQGVTFTANTVICSLPVPRCVNTIFPHNYVLLAACTSPCQKERASVMHQYFHVWVFLLVKAGIIQKKPTKSRKKPQIQKARQMSYVSHIYDVLAITSTPYMAILNYDLGQCAIALSQLENALPCVLEHLTYRAPNLTT